MVDSRRNVAEETNVSSKAIRKKVKNTLSIALKRHKLDSYILVDLDKVLDDVYCSFRPVSADYDTRKELVRNLNAMAIDIYGDSEETSPVLEAYGSFVMDTFSTKSDLDVSINFGNGTSELPREKKLQILKRFAKKLRSLEVQGHARNVKSIFSARVPIVKFSDQGTAIECDLSVENEYGILNSQIIRIISQIDDRFQKLCMLVKHWAKAHEVNSALHRTLNSVSITLLVALHLQTQNPPIAETDLKHSKLGQQTVVEPPPMSLLNGKIAETHFKHSLFGQQTVVEPPPSVLPLNGKIAETDLKHSLFEKEAVVEPPSAPSLNGKIIEAHHKRRLFCQQDVVERPHVLPLNVYPQQPHSNYRNEFNGHLEEYHNKRVWLENG